MPAQRGWALYTSAGFQPVAIAASFRLGTSCGHPFFFRLPALAKRVAIGFLMATRLRSEGAPLVGTQYVFISSRVYNIKGIEAISRRRAQSCPSDREQP